MEFGRSHARSDSPIRFRVDRTLGKLVKWLRLLGYDTEADRLPIKNCPATAAENDKRIWITYAKQSPPVEGVIQIRTDNPIEQLRQVIKTLHIQRNSLKPFTRCSACNGELVRVEREQIRGQVPDYIWEIHRQFRACNLCHKIFWPGSHVDNQRRMIDRIFE